MDDARQKSRSGDMSSMPERSPRVFAWELNDAVFCEAKVSLRCTVGDVRTASRSEGSRTHQEIERTIATLPIPTATSIEEARRLHTEGHKIVIPEMMLSSKILGLEGRPDLIIWGQRLDSFEFKTGLPPKRPSRRLGTRTFESDAAQALAYALLIEEFFPEGESASWVVYGGATLLEELRQSAVAWGRSAVELERQLARAKPIYVPLTDDNRRFVGELIERIRQIKRDPSIGGRNHDLAARCARCPYREVCGERLA